MLIKLAAQLSAVMVCAVSCAAGTGVGDLGGPTTDGDGGDTSRSAGGAKLDPPSPSPPPPPPESSEVEGSYSLDVACSDVPVIDVCLLGSHADKDVVFTLPPGTKRSSIVYTIDPQGPSAGGTVGFAGTDTLDGTVHIHGFADAFSSVHIEVTGVMVVPE
jgi:hypothetical protein